MDDKIQKKLFQEKVRQFWNNKKVEVPNFKKPLYQWIVPRITSKGIFNWSEWDEKVKLQQIGLIDFLGYNPCFFLWKLSEPREFNDSDVRIISKEEALNEYLFELMIQDYPPILQNIEFGEPKQKLVYTEDDARKKIENSLACYSIEDDGEPKGLAIISPKETMEHSFAKKNDALSCLGLGIGEQKADGIVFLDLLFTQSEKGKKYGSRLLQKIENDHPNHIIALFSVPCRSTLYFYNSKNFSYSDMSVDSPNLLPNILDKIDSCTEAWHDGFPLMTYLYPEVVLRRPKISTFTNDFNWRIRETVDIMLDDKFYESNHSKDVDSIMNHVMKEKHNERIILLSPTANMKKRNFYKIIKTLLTVSETLLSTNSSIKEVVIACENNQTRQMLLKQAACEKWGIIKKQVIEDEFIDEPVPRTPPLKQRPSSPPPLKRKR